MWNYPFVYGPPPVVGYDYFNEHYNTPLNAFEELLFRSSPLANDTRDYDARGAWLEMQARNIAYPNGHLTDRYKKPNHPTFSTGSQYHGVNDWYGGVWSTDEYGNNAFQPGSSNVYPRPDLERYMQRNESPSTVLLPRFVLPRF